MRKPESTSAERTAEPDVWTVKRVLDWSTSYLEKKGVDTCRLTAELLLAKALEVSRMELYLRFEQPLLQEELGAFRALLKRRAGREPTQYILGTQEFWSLEFQVDSRVLIPRPETECLVEEVLRLQKIERLPPGEVLELGTGSGALICALAQELPERSCVAVDISNDALEVAQENAKVCELSSRISFLAGDLWQPVEGRRFALVVSNPPYIASQECETLQEEVRLFEPRLALDGGRDGLDLIRTLLSEGPRFLVPGGMLLIEIGSGQGSMARQLALDTKMYSSVRILQDYAQLDRILVCGFQEQEPLGATASGEVSYESFRTYDQREFGVFEEGENDWLENASAEDGALETEDEPG